MHEIPADLTKSLRSYRGSVHSRSPVPEDGTKSSVTDSESEDDERQHTGSLILHPTASHRNLRRPADIDNQMRPQLPHGAVNHQPSVPMASKNPSKPDSEKESAVMSVVDPDPISAREKNNQVPLTEPDFYRLMGMRPPSEKEKNPKRLGAAQGLYTTILSKHDQINRKYKIYDIIVYVFLILQIILAAIFIVLGALQNLDTHNAVAALGAVSTVVGGVLALMKGQGLPNRLRMTRAGLQKILFEAEELYWDVCAGRKVWYSDIKKVREDYLNVIEEANRNHPDTWNTTAPNAAASSAQGVQGAQGAKGAAGKAEPSNASQSASQPPPTTTT
ncbi:MAG: hypothetical protein M1821_009562 [Bathelium mastoideum]|nr:MAG: hypothetical protein M1821_009562 [Bathelium mastoideum]